MDGPARRLAVHKMAEFFAQPIRGSPNSSWWSIIPGEDRDPLHR
jgi:hypothetical protein